MKSILFAVGLGAMFGVLILFVVFATGGTFGQRCAKAYPHDEAKQLWCVEALAHPSTDSRKEK